jgi:Protein of unknown function (DUF2971)
MPIVYKYVDRKAGRAIVANGSVRFGRPSGMNDPFDVYIEDLFHLTIEQLQTRAIPELLELIHSDPSQFQKFVGADALEVRRVADIIQSILPHERPAHYAAIAAALFEDHDATFAEMRLSLETGRQQVIAQFENTALFCITRSRDNLLMWAHYAEQHRGAVLGFRPDIERDSFFAVAKPVQYSDKRPAFYQRLDEMIAVNQPWTKDQQAGFRNALIYSKSTHWSYEEELRIDIPHGVPAGKDAIFEKFYPSELAELYLGCRADQSFRREISDAARRLNPNVTIFNVVLDKETYALKFEPAT